MKKTVALFLTLILLLTVFTCCSATEEPEKELEDLSPVNADIENEPETIPEPEIEQNAENEPEAEPEADNATESENDTESEPIDEGFFWPGDWAKDDEVSEGLTFWSDSGSIPSEGKENFVSVWPDELPDADRAERLSRCSLSTASAWLRALFLYDFPDPEDYFEHMTQGTYVGAIDTFYYGMRNSDENHYDESVTIEEFKEYVDAVKAVGYDEKAVETETSYYCEKYGVSVSIVFGNEFPWADDDYRLRPYKSQFDDCYIRVQLIDPDYVFDLDAIKAEEYQRWLESQENTEQ